MLSASMNVHFHMHAVSACSSRDKDSMANFVAIGKYIFFLFIDWVMPTDCVYGPNLCGNWNQFCLVLEVSAESITAGVSLSCGEAVACKWLLLLWIAVSSGCCWVMSFFSGVWGMDRKLHDSLSLSFLLCALPTSFITWEIITETCPELQYLM